MIVKEFYKKTFLPNLKREVEANSKYNPLITENRTQESKKFPIAVVELLATKNKFNNLSYGEETHDLGICINVYAIDNGTTSKATICDEVTMKIVEHIRANYKVTVDYKLNAPNVDSNVYRNIITIKGTLDTKYGLDKLVIYPR